VFNLRFALLIASLAGLVFLGAGSVVLQDRNAQAASALYQSEVQQTRLVEGISRRITLIDADIAAVAIGHKPPLDAHEYLRRNRPQIEKMLTQLRSHYDQVSGERRDMLDAIDYNQPDLHQLLEEINQAYLAGDVDSVGELLRQRWPIMRYALIGPLDRLLYLQQSELDTTLIKMKQQGQTLRHLVMIGLVLCAIVISLIAWRMWVFLRSDLLRMQTALGQILDGHAPPPPENPAAPDIQLNAIWRRLKNLQDCCTEQENRLAMQKRMIDAVSEGVCRLDRHGHLRDANPAAHHMLHADEASFSASSHWPELLEKARQQGEACSGDQTLCDALGQPHPLEIRVFYHPDHETDTPFVLALRDMTETQRKKMELMQAYHSIKRLEDEVSAHRKELSETRQFAFFGRLASVIVTPAGSALAAMDAQLKALPDHPERLMQALPALQEDIEALRRLLQGLDENAPQTADLPKAPAGGIE
jgi:PAS domain-containing protein